MGFFDDDTGEDRRSVQRDTSCILSRETSLRHELEATGEKEIMLDTIRFNANEVVET